MSHHQTYRCDLHIHSCLSPCAHLLMTPGNIIQRALELKLDCIAITDHNSAGNVGVAVELAQRNGLMIIPGMEVETREEVHLLCYFPTLEQLMEWDKIVSKNLPPLKNDEELIGYHLLTDLDDQYCAKDERLLAAAVQLAVEEVVEKVTGLGGMVVPSHVDRPVNSILGQLGFIPPETGIEVIEISKNTKPGVFFEMHPELAGCSYITGSDSHCLEDIGRCGQEAVGFPLVEKMAHLLVR